MYSNFAEIVYITHHFCATDTGPKWYKLCVSLSVYLYHFMSVDAWNCIYITALYIYILKDITLLKVSDQGTAH